VVKSDGNFDGDKLEGGVSVGRIHFLAKDEHGGNRKGNATSSGGTRLGDRDLRGLEASHTPETTAENHL